jgi:hypothetical protein
MMRSNYVAGSGAGIILVSLTHPSPSFPRRRESRRREQKPRLKVPGFQVSRCSPGMTAVLTCSVITADRTTLSLFPSGELLVLSQMEETHVRRG